MSIGHLVPWPAVRRTCLRQLGERGLFCFLQNGQSTLYYAFPVFSSLSELPYSDQSNSMHQPLPIPALPDYAANIRLSRKNQRLSLEQLSQLSGVSKATLSQIETGKANPTLSTLWQIAHALHLEFEELLRDPEEGNRYFEVNRGNQITSVAVPECGTVFRAISPISMAEDLEFYQVTQEPHCVHQSPPHRAGTEELIAVLKGSIIVTAGENSAELHRGDFLAFAADLMHTIKTISAEPAEFQMVVRFAR